MGTENKIGSGHQDTETPFPFPELSDKQVVAIGKALGLLIKRRSYTWKIDAEVYRLEKKPRRKPKKDVIIKTGDGTDATLYRQAFSILEARVAERLDPDTFLVSQGDPLQTTDTLMDRLLGGRLYYATLRYKERETSERVTLETRRARNPKEYRNDVVMRVPNLIAERLGRARALGAELRKAYEVVVLKH